VTVNPMTENQFRWFLTLVTGGVSAIWFLSDARKLIRTGNKDGADPTVRDQRFGYTMGLLIAMIGMVGSAMFMGWISFASAAPAHAAVTFDPVATRTVVEDFAGGQISIIAKTGDLATAVSTATTLDPEVVAADVGVLADCTFHHGDRTIASSLKGVTPRRLKNVFEKYMVEGSLQADSAAEPTIAIGGPLSTQLGVKLGDTIDVTVGSSPPRTARVVAIYTSKLIEYDLMAIMNLGTANAVIGGAPAIRTVEVQLAHDDKAKHVAHALQAKLGTAFEVTDWCELNQTFFGCTWQPSAD
jgi:hypothetical protein